MRMTRLQGTAQRRARTQQVRLTDILIEGARAQPIGERPIGAVVGRHLAPRPITSTPAGGTNENRPGENLALRCELLKVSCVI